MHFNGFTGNGPSLNQLGISRYGTVICEGIQPGTGNRTVPEPWYPT